MVIPSTKLIVLNPVIITDQKIKTKDNSSLFACINLRACQKHSAIKLTAAVDTTPELILMIRKPPVLSSEDDKQFTELFHQVADCVKPRDMVEMIYLWHFVCATWLSNRYIRFAPVAEESVV